jgi:hypothetical protein
MVVLLCRLMVPKGWTRSEEAPVHDEPMPYLGMKVDGGPSPRGISGAH